MAHPVTDEERQSITERVNRRMDENNIALLRIELRNAHETISQLLALKKKLDNRVQRLEVELADLRAEYLRTKK